MYMRADSRPVLAPASPSVAAGVFTIYESSRRDRRRPGSRQSRCPQPEWAIAGLPLAALAIRPATAAGWET